MSNAPTLCHTLSGRQLLLTLSGDWQLGRPRPDTQPVLNAIDAMPKQDGEVHFNCDQIDQWDTALVVTLVQIYQSAGLRGLAIVSQGVPTGAHRLAELALAVPERDGARRSTDQTNLIEQLGKNVLGYRDALVELVSFSGEVILSLGRFIRGQARYRGSDVMRCMQEAGAEALAIVGLISFLMGMIFAFVGIMQLQLFGAGIYTADLVAVSMVRELSPIMTAIVIAGRTGAAYAAHIGTMKVNEELDALTTLGIQPMDYLVTPRIMALVVMMPLLSVYGSLFGILGGMGVSLTMLDISLTQYVSQTIQSLNLSGFFSGLFKAVVYGSLVAIAGCQQGMACGNNALAVGKATTQAVVTSIVLIVISAALLTMIYINLGI